MASTRRERGAPAPGRQDEGLSGERADVEELPDRPTGQRPPAAEAGLALAALGVVFGDIGTSPLLRDPDGLRDRRRRRAAGRARGLRSDLAGVLGDYRGRLDQ